MKKITVLLSLFILFSFASKAQDLEYDAALRNSQNIYGGSARFIGMGGAFTALGGDISSISINPAGIAVYSGMQIVATPVLQYNETNTNMLGYADQETNYNLNFHNFGLITAYDIQNDTRWKNFNFGIGYNQLNDYNKDYSVNYFNKDYSLMHTFLDNVSLNDNFREDYEDLAFQTYMLNDFYINSVGDTIYEWWSPVTDEMNFSDTSSTIDELGVNQNKYISSRGRNGEYFISFGGNYGDKLYVGATFGIQSIKYDLTRTHREVEQNNNMLGFHSFEFIEHESHSGTGYNLKVGAIYKPTNYLRLGAAIHTPTFFNLEYTWYNEMTSDLDGQTYAYEGDTYTYNYNLITPMRMQAGAAWQIKNIGLISADYERVDYSMAKLEDEEGTNIFGPENDSITNTMGAANNFRVGAEVKLSQFYLRGGYALYQSPYNSKFEYLKSNTQVFSGGIGYREGNFFIDASFMQMVVNKEEYLYSSVYGIFNETSTVDRTRNKFILTVGLRF